MEKHTRFIVAVLASITVVSIAGIDQTLAGSCKKLTPSSTCFHSQHGMGANCGTWSCPHVIHVNHALKACANARPDEAGRQFCDALGDEQWCIGEVAACGPWELSCYLTGEWIEESIRDAVLSGAGCYG